MEGRVTKWILIFMVMSACVDPFRFDAPPPEDLIIVDGSITDAPGPYTVKISKGVDLNADTAHRDALSGMIIKLYDDEGAVETFTEREPGEYRTGGIIRGAVGHSYHITIQQPDGTILESDPEKILPSGEVFNIQEVYQPRVDRRTYGDYRADVFNIFVDGDVPVSDTEQTYVRWRFTGTYKGVTHPELHRTYLQGEFYYKTPFPCSGYSVAPALGGGVLRKDSECTCCECYIKQFETKPQLSDAELVTNGSFRNIKVGEVPINGSTFSEKYLVEIEQMIISRSTFDFFKLVRAQKDAPSSLFQPPSGKLRGNIRSPNQGQLVVGVFWAASVSRQSKYLVPADVPYVIAGDTIVQPCNTYFSNSSTTKPDYWHD